jgi:hypothetical protein
MNRKEEVLIFGPRRNYIELLSWFPLYIVALSSNESIRKEFLCVPCAIDPNVSPRVN